MGGEPKKMVWLTRVSSDRQDMARQQHACAMVRARGHQVVEEVELDGVSGTRVTTTPEWQRVTRMLLFDRTLALGCDSINRLLRPRDFEFGVLQFLSENAITIVLPDGELDLSNSNADYMKAFMEAFFAGQELRELSRRTRGGRDAQFARGEWPMGSGALPTGVAYDRETKTWSYTEPFSSTFPETVRSFLAGTITTYSEVGRRHGLGGDGGKYLLSNSIYTGMLEHVTHAIGPKRASGTRVQVRLEEPVRVDLVEVGKLDRPLIDRDTWAVLQRKVGEKSKNGKRAYQLRKAGPHRYKGILHCARCRKPLWSKEGKRTYYYADRATLRRGSNCSGYLPGNDLDELVDLTFLEGPLSTIEGVELLLREVLDLPEKGVEREPLKARLRAIEREEDVLVSKVAEDVIPDRVAVRRFDELGKEKQEIEDILTAANDVVVERSIELLADAAGLFLRWDTLGQEDRFSVLNQFFPRIYCDQSGITGVETTVLKDATWGPSIDRSRFRPSCAPPATG